MERVSWVLRRLPLDVTLGGQGEGAPRGGGLDPRREAEASVGTPSVMTRGDSHPLPSRPATAYLEAPETRRWVRLADLYLPLSPVTIEDIVKLLAADLADRGLGPLVATSDVEDVLSLGYYRIVEL